VLPIVFSVVAIAGLSAWLFVIKRREARARRPVTPSRSPQVIDRPFDPNLCAYCDEKRTAACPVCTRPLCALHAPWKAGMFCPTCEDEWETGARRRALIVVPVTVLGMMAAAGATAAVMSLASVQPGFPLLVALFGAGAPLYLGTERWMRRTFRRRGQLASARQVRR
jgi:hypothetical protein